jgi:AcrR family transcriptional regulator
MAHDSSATSQAGAFGGWRERSTNTKVEALEAARERSLERATHFVQAAFALLHESRSADFSVRQVIARSGLSRRAFYELFESKDDLLVAVYEETIRVMCDEIRRELEGIGDPVERLRVIVTELFMRSSSADRVQASALMSAEYKRLASLRPSELRAAIEPALSLLRSELEDAMRAGVVGEDDPKVLARIVLNLGLAHINTRLLDAADGETPLVTPESLWRFFRHGLDIRT